MVSVSSASLPAESVAGPAGPKSNLAVASLASPMCRFRDVLGCSAADQLLARLTERLGKDSEMELADVRDLAAVVEPFTLRACELLGVEPPQRPRLSFSLVTGDDEGEPISGATAGIDDEPTRAAFVYWLHARPRRFGGGQLRLYDLTVREGQLVLDAEYRDCPVEHDTVVFFPSSSGFELRPVTRLPELRHVNGAVDDRAGTRFAIRGWVR
ncbi:2OG-Fe(II) oxygenase [Nocardia sp. NPDC052316]|uniref:2OG-Fe(II) oxygenase n=1 Tax=Nocardia sp. NPDC052316 TaxID=3364329 RepID=UPI0037C7E5EB